MAAGSLNHSKADRAKAFTWRELALFAATAILFLQFVPRLWRAWFRESHNDRQLFASAALTDDQGRGEEVQFLVYFPDAYFSRPAWPLLIYLHGSGESGDDLKQLLNWGLPSRLDKGKHLPMIVVSPQCRKRHGWRATLLLALVDHLEKRFNVDSDRISVCGESMGGRGAWALSAAAPDRFAAAVPICGGGKIEQADRLTKLPIWAFHGARDDVVPIAANRAMVEAIRDKGGDVRFTVFPDLGHGISESVFSRDDLFTWLLAQRRRHATTPRR